MALSKGFELAKLGSGLDVNQSTGEVVAISMDTDVVSEGTTNIYFTDARVDNRVASLLAGGTTGNIVTTGYIAGPATFTIDPAGVGDNTGTVVIAGNLQVDGTQTTINSTTLDVDDLNITVASGAADSAAANGAGLTVDGAGANITYTHATTSWDFNKDINVTGTTTTDQYLYVNSPNGTQLQLRSEDAYTTLAAGNRNLNISANRTIFLDDAFAEVMRINDDGNVGIGTAAPSHPLHVAGNIAFENGDGLISKNVAGSTRTLLTLDTTNRLRIKGNAPEAVDSEIGLTLIDNGNVGIGILAPVTALHVRGTASAVGATRSVVTLTDDTAMGINVGSGVAFRGLYTSAGAEANYGGIFAGKSNANSGNANGYLSLSYSASGTLTEGIRISETGNVGIGDSTPTANGLTLFSSVTGATRLNLHIGGSGTVPNSGSYNTISNNQHADILISSNAYINGSGNPVITSTHGNMGGTGIKISGAGGSHDIKFYTSNAASVRGTELTNTERMTISETGKVGIGTSTFGTNGKLQVAGGIGLTGNSEIRQSTNSDGSTLRFLGTQFVAGAANSHSYSYTDGALIAARASHANALLFDVGANSTSGHKLKVLNDGNGIAGSLQYLNGSDTRFIVKSSTGNVGIGTATPSTKLDISTSGADGITLNADANNATLSSRLFLNNGTAGKAISIMNNGNDLSISTAATPGSGSGSEKVRILENGNVGIGTTSPSQKLDVAGNIALSGTVDGVAIAARDGVLTSTTTTANAALPLAGGTMTGDINFGDNDKASFGASNNLEIYYDGTLGRPFVYATAPLFIASTGNIWIGGDGIGLGNPGSSEYFIQCVNNGEVKLYHDNAEKLATTATGIDVTGNASFANNGKAIFGASNNLQIFSTGTSSYVAESGSGDLYIKGSSIYLTDTDNNQYIHLSDTGTGGTVVLKHNAVSKLATTATGIDVTGNITVSGYIAGPAVLTIDPAGVGDNTGKVVIAGDLQIDGTTTTINSTTLTVDDLNITLASGAADSAAANGAGITVDGANATITYDGTNDEWDFNKDVNVTGNIALSGTVDGVAIAARDGVLTSTTTTANAALPKAGGAMTGAITTNSTFDGRNVSVDGDKLDLIEAGATADQTAAQLLTAIKTVDGTGSGLDADLLDGQQGSYYYSSGNPPPLTADPTLTLTGDATGSATFTNLGNATLTVAIADDSHNHTLANIDQVTINNTNDLDTYNTRGLYNWSSSNPANSPYAYGSMLVLPDGSREQQLLQTYGGAANKVSLYGRRKTSGTWDTTWTQYFSDHYHPNADILTTARAITLTGAVTGTANFDGSVGISIATTATADPTLTLTGDATGSATFTNLGNATLTVAVANDSHYHSQVYIPDTRGSARAPSYYPDRYVSYDFQSNSDTGAGDDGWHVLQTVAKWSTYNASHRQQQIAYTGSNLKHRVATSDTAWGAWKTIWDSGNDGAASGLDADLLDGVQGSSFLRSDATDTFTTLSGTSLTTTNLTVGSSAKINFQNNDSISFNDGDGVGAFSFNADAGTANALLKAGAATFSSVTVSGTVDGVDIAARNGVLTSTTTTANAALPKAGGTMTGPLTIDTDNNANGGLRLLVNQTNPEQDFYFAQEIVSTLSGATVTTADREQGGIWIDLNSTATGGGTNHEHRVYGAYLDVDSTGDADMVYGVFADATVTPSTGQTSQVTGGYFKAEDNGGAGAVSSVFGVQGLAQSDNATSDTNTLIGGYFKTTNIVDTGNVTTASAVYGEIEIAAGTGDHYGTSHVFQAQYDNNDTVAQTNTTYLYYGNYAGVLPTTAYGVYIADAVTSYFGGTIRSAGDVVAYYSDERLKDFHGTIPNAMDKVKQLNGYYFTENQLAKDLGYNNDSTQVGVSAQEVEAVLPEIVKEAAINTEKGTDYKTVQYEKLTALLIEAVKEQQTEIDELKKLVKDLMSR